MNTQRETDRQTNKQVSVITMMWPWRLCIIIGRINWEIIKSVELQAC